MKHVFVIAAALFICIQSISAQDNVGFKYKNEIELKGFGFYISNSGFNVRSSVLYRRFLSNKFALQTEIGLDGRDVFSKKSSTTNYNYNHYILGLGAVYFLNENHNGLYLTSMLTYTSIWAKEGLNSDGYLTGKIGAGYRIGIGKSFYISPEFNLVSRNFRSLSSETSFNLGVKF